MTNPLDSFYLNQQEPNAGCLLALRSIILQQGEEITETQKYGMPCFCFKEKPFCYLWTDKKTNWPYLLMAEGKRLVHPALEAGNRARMKTFTVNPEIDLPLATILEILDEALFLYKSGKIKS